MVLGIVAIFYLEVRMSDEFADPGQIWADKAPEGWIRCEDCGEEWWYSDESGCECEEE
jgi:hypothetical protein|tara:strand:- start:633 stop:806 length:174 start_codon:yes stop_codon:yes gene_type:complete